MFTPVPNLLAYAPHGNLQIERPDRLSAAGFVWDRANEDWTAYYAELRNQQPQHGERRRYIEPDTLAGWASEQRRRRLEPYQCDLLDAIGFPWDTTAFKMGAGLQYSATSFH